MNADTTKSSGHAPKGFSFRKRWNSINWRSLASVDVDKIAQEMDIQGLQANIINIAFCSVESEDFHNLDANFIKLFRLSQLTIEYLLHSQQYLSDHGTQLEGRLEAVQQDLVKTQQQLSIKAGEIKALKKESRRRRQLIEAYQDMINAGATGLHNCTDCGREFVSAEYLRSHLQRRHPDHLLPKSEGLKPNFEIHYDALEKRLMEQMLEHLKVNEKMLRDHMEEKEKESLEAHAKEFDEWKKCEQSKMMLVMQEFKEPILEELKTLRQEKASLMETLQQTRDEFLLLKTKKVSRIGKLEGAEMLIEDESTENVSDIKQVKEEVEAQVHEMHFALKRQEKLWKGRLHKLGTTYQDQIKDKLEQHETQLRSQQAQLSLLQSQDSSPADVRISTASPSRSNVLLTIGDNGPDVDTVSDSGSSIGESDLTSIDKDEVDTPSCKHCSEIKTLFVHEPEVLESIKQESRIILKDALIQRGVDKNAVGITMSQFEDKLQRLSKERQERMQRHHNFAGIKETVYEKLHTMVKHCYGDQREHKQELRPSTTESPLVAKKPPKPAIAQPKTSQLGTVSSSLPCAVHLDVLTSTVAAREANVVDSAPSNDIQTSHETSQASNTLEGSSDSPWDSAEEQFPSGQTSIPCQDDLNDRLDTSDVRSHSPVKSQRKNTSSDMQFSDRGASYSVLTTVSNDLEDSDLSSWS